VLRAIATVNPYTCAVDLPKHASLTPTGSRVSLTTPESGSRSIKRAAKGTPQELTRSR
jgi:hypothetical protein